jgi:superfamily II DNA/RNA helicase
VPAVFNFDIPFNAEDYVHRIGRTGRAGASGLAVSFVSGSDARLVADIEKLIGKKIELEAVEFDEDTPRIRTQGRINDGRRAWGGDDPRDVIDAPPRSPRPQRPAEAPRRASRDPFFDQPYQATSAEAAPAWEAAARNPAARSISANIKPKRKVAALFKARPAVPVQVPEASTAETA